MQVVQLICCVSSLVAEVMEQPQSSSTSRAQASVYQPASLSRVFIGVQPGRGVARLTKVGKPSGPMSLVSDCCLSCLLAYKWVNSLAFVAFTAFTSGYYASPLYFMRCHRPRSRQNRVTSHTFVAVVASVHCGGNHLGCSEITIRISCAGV